MDEAIKEISNLVAKRFTRGVAEVRITPSLSVSGDDACVVPGRFRVFIIGREGSILQQAERQWNADEGFHFVLGDPPLDYMSNASDKRWDEKRRNEENQTIEQGEAGVDNAVLELRSDVKNEGQPTNYRVAVQIGRASSNRISLQVDSGSSVLWAQSRVRRSQIIPPNRSFLDMTIAGAAHFQKGTDTYKIVYGNTKEVEVSLFKAPVTIGDLETEQVFGVAGITSKPDELPLGILGLGFARENSPVPFHRTLVVQLKESGKIKRASFALVGPRAEPAGTIPPTSHQTRDRGWLIIGALEDKYHNGITWCPALVEKYRSWVVRLNKVTVNGTVICENQLALVDTGSSYLSTSKRHCDKVAAVIKGRVRNDHVVYPTGALKEFSFTFGKPGAEATFWLNDEDLSLGPVPDGEAGERRSPVNWLKDSSGESRADFWVLGGIFIDNMITIFDYTGDKRIGFASRSNIDPVVAKASL